MTEAEVVRIMREHLEGQFPKVCNTCKRRYATLRQYLQAALIDELHLVQVPLLMGQGERIFEDLGGVERLYECVEFTPSKAVSHLRIVKTPGGAPAL